MSWGCDDFVSILAHSPLAGRDSVGMRTHPIDVMLSSAKVVGFLTIKPSFWLMARPEIKSMAELKKKTIGITAIGSSTDTLARFLLSKNGLTPDRDVAFLGTGTTSNILTAMKGGTVDAGVLSPPFNAMAKQMGYRTLAYFGDYVEQSLSGACTSDKMIRERPELVKRM